MGSNINDVLVKLDPKTGAMQTMVGMTGFPKLFGVAAALEQVFAFTHDGSGDVITADPKTGKGTLFGSGDGQGHLVHRDRRQSDGVDPDLVAVRASA